jgi:hypothetical protein
LSNVLIIGDSFAADWSTKYKDYLGWPNLLAEQHQVTNLAQAGVSEYKIYRQLLSVEDLSVYDIVIVAHTSPLRVPTRRHPMHSRDVLHKNADLIYADIRYHASRLKNIFNSSLQAAKDFYRYHYDDEFFEDSYVLFRKEINAILANKKVITIATFKLFDRFVTEKNILDFTDLLNTEPGLINHYSQKGNQLVYKQVSSTIYTLLKENV